MARYGYGASISSSRKSIVSSSGGTAPITTSRAFDYTGEQVGSTNTGDIPASWLLNANNVSYVIFANNNSVTSIGNYAFSYCPGLTGTLTIPNSVTTLGGSIFRSCNGLTSAVFGSGLTSTGSYTFRNCNSLTSVTIPNSVTSIGYYAFSGCTSLPSITIPNSVISIGSYAFQGCTNLINLTFTPTSSLIGISEYAFNNCTSLSSVTLPSSVTSIASYSFNSCASIASFIIGNSVASIGNESLFGCTSLTTITIPNSVTSIGNSAFANCTSLVTVLCYVAQSAFSGSDAFAGTASPLTIRARSTDSSWTAGTGLTFQGNTNVTVIKNLQKSYFSFKILVCIKLFTLYLVCQEQGQPY